MAVSMPKSLGRVPSIAYGLNSGRGVGVGSGVSVGSGSGVSVGSGVLLNMESISPGFCVSPGTTLSLSLPELLSTSMPSVSAIINNTSIITNFAVILRLLRRRVFMRKQYLSAYLYKVFFPVLYSATRLSSSLSNFTNL